MIILEGPDAVGKTTAARRLVALSEGALTYKHHSRPPDGYDYLLDGIKEIGPHAQDRFHLGALTYGVMLGRGPSTDYRSMLALRRYLRWRGALVVVMYAYSDDWLRSAFLRKDQSKEMYGLSDVLVVNQCYQALLQEGDWADEEHDVTKGYPSDEKLCAWLSAWRERWRE